MNSNKNYTPKSYTHTQIAQKSSVTQPTTAKATQSTNSSTTSSTTSKPTTKNTEQVNHIPLSKTEMSFVVVDLLLQGAFDIPFLTNFIVEQGDMDILASDLPDDQIAILDIILSFDLDKGAIAHYENVLELNKEKEKQDKEEEKKSV